MSTSIWPQPSMPRSSRVVRSFARCRTGTSPLLQSFGYDLAGNLTTADGSQFATYDAANKIISLPGGSAGYDGDGNLTGVSGTNVPAGTFTWDDMWRLTSHTAGGVT